MPHRPVGQAWAPPDLLVYVPAETVAARETAEGDSADRRARRDKDAGHDTRAVADAVDQVLVLDVVVQAVAGQQDSRRPTRVADDAGACRHHRSAHRGGPADIERAAD